MGTWTLRDCEQEYPPYKYEPFSKEWNNKLGRTLWDLAHRGFAMNSKDENVPKYPVPWGLKSEEELYSIRGLKRWDEGRGGGNPKIRVLI